MAILYQVRTQLLHYSDFFFREMDWWIGTVLYLTLLLLTLLPISYLHSKMLFNSAFADTLSQVNHLNPDSDSNPNLARTLT